MNHLKTFRQFIKEEDGMGTVEVILIIVVLVGLVVIFKEKITEIVNSIFSKITNQTKKILVIKSLMICVLNCYLLWSSPTDFMDAVAPSSYSMKCILLQFFCVPSTF